MILATSAIIKVLLVLAVLLLGYRIFRKKLQKKTLVSLGVLILLFAVFANWAVGLVPPLTDTVTLTALGKGREEAENTEIFLKGYTIDGEESLALEDLQISSGHWFWIGDMYCWRPKSDERQPDGVTESVELQIPVGWNRTLNFQSSIYRGEVQIETAENTWVIDTYSEENGEITEQIGRSSTAALIWNQIFKLEVYTLLLVACFSIIWVVARKVLRSPEKAKGWLKRNKGKLTYAFIATVSFIFMTCFSDHTSFWGDELLQINFSNGTIQEAIQFCLQMNDATPPLFTIIATLLYSIIPYGEQWLLLLSIIPTALGIYLIGVIGSKLYSNYVGLLAELLCVCSTTVYHYVAFEFRAYAFLFFFSILTFYLYIRRNEEKNLSKRYGVLLGVCMAFLTMSHYFGMIACGIYFLSDIYLSIKNKMKFKSMIIYLIPGLVSVSWLILIYVTTLRYRETSSIASWYPVPGISQIENLLQFLTGNQEIGMILLAVGIASSIVIVWEKRKEFNWKNFYNIFLIGNLFITVSLLVLYGNIINQESTMWQNRYFIFLIPFVVLLSAVSLAKIHDISLNRIICIAICIVLGINCTVYVSTETSSSPFRQSADWIYSHGKYIYDTDSMVIFTAGRNIVEGWSEYYVMRKGRRDPLNIKYQLDIHSKDLSSYNKIYLNYIANEPIAWLDEYLDSNFILEENNSHVRVSVYVRK